MSPRPSAATTPSLAEGPPVGPKRAPPAGMGRPAAGRRSAKDDRGGSGMTVRFAQLTIDVADTDRAGRFWAAALGYDLQAGGDGHAWLVPRGIPSGTEPTVWLQNTGDQASGRQTSGSQSSGKNPVHPDLVVVDEHGVDAEV